MGPLGVAEATTTTTTTTKRESKTSSPTLSKRQRRKIPNDAHKWNQQPRIKSPEARARAYVFDANLSRSTTAEKRGEALDPSVDLHGPEMKFGRMLGGSDQRSRHVAVKKLGAYLKARCDIANEGGGISELDLMKLWKGLWYTLYMADKVPVQDELSRRLAELIWCVAGTEEEDEYAAQVYLDMNEDDDGDEAAEGEEEGGDEEEEEDDDEDVTMEVISDGRAIERGSDDGDDGTESDDEAVAARRSLEDDDARETDGDSDDDAENDEDEEDDDDDSEDEEDETVARHCRGAHLAALFVRTFLRTMRREWPNVDKHRVDKFYTAVRLMISQVYKYMSTRHWNLGIIRLFNDAIFEEVLSRTPNGLRNHLVDLTLEELAKVNSRSPMPLTEATLLDCLEPYFAMAQNVDDRTVHGRVMDNVLEKFLTEFSVVSDRYAPPPDEEGGGGETEGSDANASERALVMDQVHVGSVAQFVFELASDAETRDDYRKALYDTHKRYARAIKDAGRDVEIFEANEDEEDDGIEEAEGDNEEEEEDETEEAHGGHDAEEGRRSDSSRRESSTAEVNGPRGALAKDAKSTEEEEVQRTRTEGSAGDGEPKTKSDQKKKKKKKKKKQSKKEKRSEEDEVGEAAREEKGEATAADEAEASTSLRDDTAGDEDEDGRDGEEVTDDVPSNKKRKKDQKKRRRRKSKGKETEGGPAAADEEGTDDLKEEKRRRDDDDNERSKKSNGKRAKATGGPSDGGDDEDGRDDGDDEEEVVTISKKEQKKAAKAAKRAAAKAPPPRTPPRPETFRRINGAKKGGRRSPPSVDPHAMVDSDGVMSDVDEDDDVAALRTPRSRGAERRKDGGTKEKKQKPSDADRRVSFGRVNRSKSYKASMKDLKTKKPPSTATQTPDRGILLKRGHMAGAEERGGGDDDGGKVGKKKRAKSLSSMPRKKATDYF